MKRWIVTAALTAACAISTGSALYWGGVAPTAQAVSVDDSRRTAIVQAIEKAAPAVVSVNVVQMERTGVIDPFFGDFWEFFHGAVPRYQVREKLVRSVGSGFIFSKEGHILTNFHVIEGAASVSSVSLADGRVVAVDVVGYDARTDLAVLKAREPGLPHVDLGNSSGLITGEWAIAIGNPFGPLMRDPQPTVSVGVISANHRRISPDVGGGERLYQDMIQTDAAINPGNSGGPLVNCEGQVIGVNTMIFSRSGGSVGLGFAIPIDRAKRVASEIIEYGRRRDPWPGFKAEDIRKLRGDFLRARGITAEAGALVVDILPDSPAYQAGLRTGDVISAVNGEPVFEPAEVDFVFWGLFVGDRVALDVLRGNEHETVSFAVSEVPSQSGGASSAYL